HLRLLFVRRRLLLRWRQLFLDRRLLLLTQWQRFLRLFLKRLRGRDHDFWFCRDCGWHLCRDKCRHKRRNGSRRLGRRRFLGRRQFVRRRLLLRCGKLFLDRRLLLLTQWQRFLRLFLKRLRGRDHDFWFCRDCGWHLCRDKCRHKRRNGSRRLGRRRFLDRRQR